MFVVSRQGLVLFDRGRRPQVLRPEIYIFISGRRPQSYVYSSEGPGEAVLFIGRNDKRDPASFLLDNSYYHVRL